MMWFLITAVWVGCSVLSYGLLKGAFLNHLEFFTEKGINPTYGVVEEKFITLMSLNGPFSLIVELICLFTGPESFTSKGMRLCFRMPEKYKKK